MRRSIALMLLNALGALTCANALAENGDDKAAAQDRFLKTDYVVQILVAKRLYFSDGGRESHQA